MSDTAARKNMVDSQILTNKVMDERVIAAISSIPREEFVPEKYRGVAYMDDDIPLGEGRFLMEPMIFARLLVLAAVKRTDKVLVIGAGTGYPAAVIAQLASRVVAVEDDLNFISASTERMKKLEIKNVSVINAPLTEGAARQKPFDLIFINGAVEEISSKLTAQLSDDGRIIAVKAEPEMPNGPFYAVAMHKDGKILSEARHFQAFIPRLTDFNRKRGFDF